MVENDSKRENGKKGGIWINGGKVLNGGKHYTVEMVENDTNVKREKKVEYA